MPSQGHEPLEQLVEALLASPKYQQVHPDFLRRIGSGELAKGRTLKKAVKATKNKLHQVGGAYFKTRPDYAAWIKALKAAAKAPDDDDFKQACKEIMWHHASTKERLPILEEFFTSTLAELPPIHSVLDLACGLNPLAIPWMPLAEGASYQAHDIYQDMVAFLNNFFTMTPVNGEARASDVLDLPSREEVELALLLKAIPCLEQVDKSAGEKLLAGINADHLLVSFPAHSLGGVQKGMIKNYEERFLALLEGRGWSVQRFVFPSELAFLVSK